MLVVGVIEESVEHPEVLHQFEPYRFSQRIEHVPEDEYPTWHVNEYHIPENVRTKLLGLLSKEIKLTWYIHAFDDEHLYVVLRGKYFTLPLTKDESWNEMIEYGTKVCQVDPSYLQDIPTRV